MVAFVLVNPWTIGLAAAAGAAVATLIWQESGGPEATADALDSAMDAVGDIFADDDPLPLPIDPGAAMEAADAAADALDDVAVGEICTSCPDPCLPLKGGNPAGTGDFRGGAYGHLTGPGIQAHHTPANSVSPLSRWNGPAIQMTPADHRQTASYGNGAAARAYRTQQASLIASGQFMSAVAMDVVDVRRVAAQSGDPARYDAAIGEMLAYAGCLKATGQVL